VIGFERFLSDRYSRRSSRRGNPGAGRTIKPTLFSILLSPGELPVNL